MVPSGADAAAREFERHRSVLFTLVYELLGSAADADDVVQETWLRRQRVTGPVEHERALLCRIATRVALNAMRAQARRREDYVGPWLPEPIAVSPDVLDDVVLAESVSQATLAVLETLSPEERAAFVLTEVFGSTAAEAGEALERSEASVRQLAHRARDRLREGRPHRRAGATPEVWHAFTSAIRAGDLAATTALLTGDSVLVSDGGGKVSSARRPVLGAENIARFLLGLATQHPDISIDLVPVNGEHALLVREDGAVSLVLFLETGDGGIRTVRIMRNPEKLGRLEKPVAIAR
ncbi:sigma-70 family RNA polymerase sigma factor [Pseudoclavibacter endophyticus]|uniref:Sigma-70 family RNA polymerase sigma factor n=1 Tax=Pseudoclavibacter endophyticus TaxID=1778590 RepID=A0A6H9WPR9_9MICO|nr:sigma-70 family RNA polymerase sigma factor [Pseudoclavibacter endophyticus]